MRSAWKIVFSYNGHVAYRSALQARDYHFSKSLLNLSKKGYINSGTFSVTSKRRILKNISNLVEISNTKRVMDLESKKSFKFKVSFITLTLSATQIHTDKEIKDEIFIPFLELMSKVHNMSSYVWRAERQRNGNIHFHICTNVYIHYIDLVAKWNRAQNKLHYIDRFETKHKHRKANSVDVHSVIDVNSVGRYVAKYMAKGSDDDNILGRMHACSHNISKFKRFTIDELESNFTFFSSLSHPSLRIPFDNEFVCLYRGGVKLLLSSTNYIMIKEYLKYMYSQGYNIDMSGYPLESSAIFKRSCIKTIISNKLVYNYKFELL